MKTNYLVEEFVNVRLGESYRLFKFGRIYKNGKVRNITPEYAAKFKLPHFKPPVKLGSHEDPTPAGGHIVGLEVRSDGLYAMPEWNDKGVQAISDGAFRYHSPEVLFDGALEDPETGGMINAPILVGDALLHTPHLGEAAALYEIEVINKEIDMEENMTIPKSFWDKFIAPLFTREPEVKEVVKTVEPEDYAATKQERDELKMKIEAQEAEVKRAARVEKFTSELKQTKADIALAELLSDLPDEKAELVMSQFKALSAQIDDSKLLGEKGTEGGEADQDPKAAFNALVLAVMKEKNIANYNAAFEVVKAEQPDLFKAWAK